MSTNASNEAWPFSITPDQLARTREHVLETAEYYGINAENAIIIGGAGLALHHVYTAVDIPPPTSDDPEREFDVDALLLHGARIGRRLRLFGDVIHFSDDEAPLSLTLMRRSRVNQYAFNSSSVDSAYPHLPQMLEDRVVIDGIATLPVGRLTEAKLSSYGNGRVKDYAGIIGAHIAARAIREATVDNPDWREMVIRVMGMIDPNRPNAPMARDTKLPPWLNDIVDRNFDHPALKDLRQGLRSNNK